MEYSYSLTRKDLKAVTSLISKLVWKKPNNFKSKIFLQIINVALWVPVGIFIGYSFNKSDDLGRWAIYSILIVIAIKWIYRLIEHNAAFKLPNNTGPILGPMKLSLDESGVTVKSTYDQTKTSWNGIQNIENTGKYIFIFVDNHIAHFIPADAIGNNEAIENFITQANSMREKYAT